MNNILIYYAWSYNTMYLLHDPVPTASVCLKYWLICNDLLLTTSDIIDPDVIVNNVTQNCWATVAGVGFTNRQCGCPTAERPCTDQGHKGNSTLMDSQEGQDFIASCSDRVACRRACGGQSGARWDQYCKQFWSPTSKPIMDPTSPTINA